MSGHDSSHGGGHDWAALRARLAGAEARLAASMDVGGEALDRLLAERARHLAGRTGRARPGTDARSALVVRVGGEAFGIELAGLCGILPSGDVAVVPGGPRELLGIVGARGEMWAVHDLGRLVGVAGGTGTGPIVLLRHPQRRVALRVDAAERVEPFSPGALRGIGEQRGELRTSLIAGLIADAVLLIDLEALWSHRAIGEAL